MGNLWKIDLWNGLKGRNFTNQNTKIELTKKWRIEPKKKIFVENFPSKHVVIISQNEEWTFLSIFWLDIWPLCLVILKPKSQIRREKDHQNILQPLLKRSNRIQIENLSGQIAFQIAEIQLKLNLELLLKIKPAALVHKIGVFSIALWIKEVGANRKLENQVISHPSQY